MLAGPAGDGALDEAVRLTLALPRAVYEALAAVAHGEGHAIEDQARRAIEEMLAERKRRPLFD